jgi:hypothetical protein
VELIEEGKRPSYPDGSIIDGQDVGANQVDENDGGLLVEKYTYCSLYPIFDKIVAQVKKSVEN